MNEYERHIEGASGTAGTGETRKPEEIEREIEMTRERMSRDIDELGDRLSPQNLKRQAKEALTGKAQNVLDNARGKARDTGTSLFDFVRENPPLVAAVGLGAVWLMQQRNRSEISGDRMARFAYTGPERRTSGATGRVYEERGYESRKYESRGSESRDYDESAYAEPDLGQTAYRGERYEGDRPGESRRGMGQRVGELAGSARGGVENAMHDKPLALAAGAVILGLTLGLLIPESDREHRVMGPTRDNLMDRARGTAQRVKEAAKDATNEVREVVREEAEERGPGIKASLKDAAAAVGEEIKGAAGRVKDEAKQAAKTSGTRGTSQV